MTDNNQRRTVSRPAERELPELVPGTPENIMQAILGTPSKQEGDWKCLAREAG